MINVMEDLQDTLDGSCYKWTTLMKMMILQADIIQDTARNVEGNWIKHKP